ncbi:MAG TPA: amino acid ABC transporter ATP-binding protein [Pirellulales bacterium]|jgi:ABC-type polar amino acid transport system ATPase subunit|nr:amino acid ABC transporter ATP-binding protein [Pirellulales bacterium]
MTEAGGEPLISIRGLTKSFGPRKVLDGVDLSIHAGETLVVLGPSGGGKSTLLRCINGLNDWDSGQIQVGPHTIKAAESRTNRSGAWLPIRRLVGMVFQDYQLFPHLTALDNVAEAPVKVLKLRRPDALARGRELLDRVGLADRASAFPEQLSGGQKQRVAIARALAMQPQGLLCDEITSALDPELKHEVLSVLETLKRDGLTLVMVTHEIGFARRAADRVVVLADGQIIEDGPPAQVLDAPRSQRTKQLLAAAI